jgi:hypothetical protein
MGRSMLDHRPILVIITISLPLFPFCLICLIYFSYFVLTLSLFHIFLLCFYYFFVLTLSSDFFLFFSIQCFLFLLSLLVVSFYLLLISYCLWVSGFSKYYYCDILFCFSLCIILFSSLFLLCLY